MSRIGVPPHPTRACRREWPSPRGEGFAPVACRWNWGAALVLPFFALFAFVGAAPAQELAILSAGAVEPGLERVAEAFRKDTGHEVQIQYAPAPALREALRAGLSTDVLIAPTAVLADPAGAGKLGAEAPVTVGRVGVGVAVRKGLAKPDVATVDALKAAVLGADRVIYNRASTGLYVEEMLRKLGIAAEIGKTERFPDGAAVMERLIAGSGNEIGLGAITEIGLFQRSGLQLVGPLPAEVQNFTTYAAATVASARNPEGARTFLRFLQSERARALLRPRGVE
jgi:molybdate transport system substrate-binding protein